MNNKGQALVMFVILIPVLLIVAALVIDTGLVINKKLTVLSIIENESTTDGMFNSLSLNNIEVSNIKESSNCFIINTKVESIFGKVIGKNEYEIEVEKCE